MLCYTTLCRLTVSSSKGQKEVVEGDAVVFAVGVKAMQAIVSSSPDLAACPVGTYPPMLHLHRHLGLVPGCVAGPALTAVPKVGFAGSVVSA